MSCSQRLLTAATLVSLTSLSCGGSTPTAPSQSTTTSKPTLVSATMSGANVTLASVGQTTGIVEAQVNGAHQSWSVAGTFNVLP